MKKWIPLALLCLFSTLLSPALANYIMPEPTAQYLILVGPTDWSINDHQLMLKRAAQSYPVEDMWLCHYRDSDAICTGKYHQRANQMLSEIRQQQGKKGLWVRIITVAANKGATTLAADIRLYNGEAFYANASKVGCEELKLNATQVQALGQPATLKRLTALSEANWQKLQSSAKNAPPQSQP